MEFLSNLLTLSLEAAPWLVMGLIIGGAFKALIPEAFLHRHLKSDGLSGILKAALLGAPLPLCSCGVIPAALGLRKSGVSKPATASFLVSTPETGVDSISLTYVLLGPFMAIVRPIAAIISAVTTGLLVRWLDPSDSPVLAEETSCCAKPSESSQPSEPDCCSTKSSCDTEVKKISVLQEAWQGVRYAFSTLLTDIAFWLAIGMLFAAAVQTFVPSDFLTQWGNGLFAMLIMLVVGVPMYVCATASTPIAVGLIIAGISPGTALVFLMAGPATNVSTMGVIAKHLGKRSLLAYLIGVCSVALLSGLTVDLLISHWDLEISTQLHQGQNMVPLGVQYSCLVLLLVTGSQRLWQSK